ncbi:hypothetical protein GTZ78_04935 [Streptomyces sp. SID8361]|nr:hypothetical protein [Streptomyces sp. SID8361]
MDTIAGGITVSQPGGSPLGIVAKYVNRVVTVEESSFAVSVMRLLEQSKQVVEPAGAAGVAAILKGHLERPSLNRSWNVRVEQVLAGVIFWR